MVSKLYKEYRYKSSVKKWRKKYKKHMKKLLKELDTDVELFEHWTEYWNDYTTDVNMRPHCPYDHAKDIYTTGQKLRDNLETLCELEGFEDPDYCKYEFIESEGEKYYKLLE